MKYLKMISKIKNHFIIILILTIITSSTVVQVVGKETEPITTIELLVQTEIHYNYGQKIAKYLAAIGMKIVLEHEKDEAYFIQRLEEENYDLAFITFTGETADPDLSHIYGDGAPYNYFGITTNIPYCSLNQDMLQEGAGMTNLPERQQHYYDWQMLLMDKIVPILPFFSLTERGDSLPYKYDLLAFNLNNSFWGAANNYIWLDKPGKEEYPKGVALRKAICHSINRTEINNEINTNPYTINHSPISYYIPLFYYEEIIKYNYDLEEAFEWLEAAGFTDITPYESNFGYLTFLLIPFLALIYKRKKNLK
ncbi:MAG: ABC transporter substrate-binding protein [Candidatus Heimdallarchaeaceae archaeon]|jgi:ABC-type transport system substrate-binding protein